MTSNLALSMNRLCTPFLLLLSYCAVHHAHAADPDYVIVGAGTAGCALAARLCTLLPRATITLMERSPPRDRETEFIVRSPRQVRRAWLSSKTAELFFTEPGSGILNRKIQIYTGSTLGGTSSINGMQWVVPTRGTVEKYGIKGLSTDSSRLYYERAFKQVGFAKPRVNQRHVYAGDYMRAAAAAGFPENGDPFDTRSARDMFENRLAIDKKDRRVDSCTAYLKPVVNGTCKHNLRLIQGVTATRILLDEHRNKRATGVEYVRSFDKGLKNRMIIRAKREVILSAGPFGSPKLLQLSGIGPPSVLRKAGIAVKVDLPVGVKTQARPSIVVRSMYKGVPLEPSNNSTLLYSPDSRRQWENGRGGVLGVAPSLANGRDKQDGYLVVKGSFTPELEGQPLIGSFCFTNVKSLGHFRIRDSNPFTPPDVDLALLSEKEDVDRSERCLNRMANIHRKFPRSFKLSFDLPTNGIVNRTFIRSAAGWAGHYVGGCAVGSVLHPDLTVRNVSHLRVVDASSLSVIPASAGPMSSIYMLAEYMSEQIATSFK